MRYVLDTSAAVAHIRREPGHAVVQSLLQDSESEVFLAAPSIVEMEVALRRKLADAGRSRAIVDLYATEIASVLSADRAAAFQAIALRASAGRRLPAMDALIAGCAAARDAVLVHRDPHFDGIPADRLKTLRLPDTEDAPPTAEDVRAVARESGSSYRMVKTKSAKTRRRTKPT